MLAAGVLHRDDDDDEDVPIAAADCRPVVDEAALFEALRERRIHAAGIDVW